MSANCPEAVAVKLERLASSSAEAYVYVERAELRKLLNEYRYQENQLQVVANAHMSALARIDELDRAAAVVERAARAEGEAS